MNTLVAKVVLQKSHQSQNKITMTKDLKTQKGFTLIELLIVMAIIGILSGFFVTNFVTARNKTTDAVRKSNLAQLQKALDFYDPARPTTAWKVTNNDAATAAW